MKKGDSPCGWSPFHNGAANDRALPMCSERFPLVSPNRQAVLAARRRRPTSVAAAAPNRISIGGAGTSWPPEVLEVEPPEVELDVELEVLEEVELEPDEELLVDELPLDEPLELP